jgi:hypothetical protein
LCDVPIRLHGSCHNNARGGFSTMAAGTIYDECYQHWKEFHFISVSHCIRETGNVILRLMN